MKALNRAIWFPVLLLSCLIDAPAAAAISPWQQLPGPEGGSITALAINRADGQNIYAGTWDAGIFKTSNAGASWRVANGNLPGVVIMSLATDPTGQTVYAGLGSSGVWKTVDGGATWSAANSGLPDDSYAMVIALDPANSQTVYLADGNGALFKSTDGAASWLPSTSGLPASGVCALAVDPADSRIVYAGTYSNALFKSGNGGTSWSAAASGLPVSAWVKSVVVDPTSHNNVYLSTDSELYKSSDSGATWALVKSGMVTPSLAITRSGLAVYAAGTWGSGVFRSSDRGASWSEFRTGLPPECAASFSVNALVADPSGSDTVYAGSDYLGVFKSASAGAWGRVNHGLTNTGVYAIATDPSSSQTIYAGTAGNGVFKTLNGGVSWSAVNAGLHCEEEVRALALDPRAPQTLFAVGAGGIYKSGNGGAAWTQVSQESTRAAVAIDPSDSKTVYVGGYGAVLKSGDSGNTWARAIQGLPQYCVVTGLAVDPRDSRVVYAATTKGVSKSTDGGSNWLNSSTGMSDTFVNSLAIDPSNSATIYAATSGGGVFKSLDGGALWNAVNNGLENGVVYSVRIDPRQPSILYAATDYGLARSEDGGGSWVKLPQGLPPYVALLSSGIDPVDSDILYAGSDGRGIFKTLSGPPTISGTPASSVTAGKLYTFTPTASNAARFAITGKPNWASFDEPTGTLSGTPGNGNAGSYPGIVISASNSDGQTAALPAFGITVVKDLALPAVTAFSFESPWKSLTVPVKSFSASDDAGVTGYLITASTIAPLASAAAWSPSAPASYTFAGAGFRTVYGWVKDGAGNVSLAKAATVNIDQTAPTVWSFSAKSPLKNRSVPITSFTATDNSAVTGYLVTESDTAPLPSSSDWKTTPPTSYQAGSGGLITLRAFAKDGAGNVSQAKSAAVSIDEEAPQITSFSAPALARTLSIPITSFVASDNVQVTGYLITATATLPAYPAWSTTPPVSFYAGTAGQKTLYAWARDAAGNVSSSAMAVVTVDSYAPVVSAFAVATPYKNLTVPVLSFSASDNTGVAGYLITTSALAPAATAPGWSETPPASFTLPNSSIKVLYGWAKDAAGNVSLARSTAVNVDQTAPVIWSFLVKTPSKSTTVTVTSLSATDNTAVTGYLINESPDPPPPSGSGWKLAPPTSYSADSAGTKTLYAWARDGAGNVSLSKSAAVSIDVVAPQVTSFAAPAQVKTMIVPITSFSASDDVKVTGYLVTASSLTPSPLQYGWNATPPTSFSSAAAGKITLYAWAKDAAGNVSSSASAPVTIDTIPPVVTAFTLATPVHSLTVPVNSFSASDGTAVTGYKITTSTTPPLATESGWSDTPPTSYLFTSAGTKALYGWAKDAAGNVSAPRMASTYISIP